MRALAQQPKGAFIFHPLEWGGWLGWNLGASRCESDTRLVLQGPEFLSRHVSILDHPAIWAETTSTQIAWLPIAHALRYRPLLVSLLSSSSWRLVHFDGVSAILVRDPVVWSLQPDTLPGASLGEETGGNVRLRQKVTQEASEVLFQSRRFLAALAWDQDALK